jgi:hypothetical protein
MKQPEMSCLCCRCVVDGMHSLCLVEGWCHHFSLCVLQSMMYNMKTTKFELFCCQIWVVQLQNCCVETCRTSKDLNWFATYLELTMCVAAGYLVTGFKPHHQQILCGHHILKGQRLTISALWKNLKQFSRQGRSARNCHSNNSSRSQLLVAKNVTEA